MDLRDIFAANLRRLRHEKGLAQDDLAYEAKVSRSYLSQLEKGAFYASLKILEKLAKALDVEPYELIVRATDRHRLWPMLLTPYSSQTRCPHLHSTIKRNSPLSRPTFLRQVKRRQRRITRTATTNATATHRHTPKHILFMRHRRILRKMLLRFSSITFHLRCQNFGPLSRALTESQPGDYP
jgi:transcriptional regulator with XRE-family HTH domain